MESPVISELATEGAGSSALCLTLCFRARPAIAVPLLPWPVPPVPKSPGVGLRVLPPCFRRASSCTWMLLGSHQRHAFLAGVQLCGGAHSAPAIHTSNYTTQFASLLLPPACHGPPACLLPWIHSLVPWQLRASLNLCPNAWASADSYAPCLPSGIWTRGLPCHDNP